MHECPDQYEMQSQRSSVLLNGEEMCYNDQNDQQERLMQSFISTMTNNNGYDAQRLR